MAALARSAQPWMGEFESLGANCEFGFVLRRCGIEGSALLRWAELFSIATVTRLVRQDFAGLYEWENLRPFNAGMVRDAGCGICWHTLIRSEPIDPAGPPVAANFRFATAEGERWRIWAAERKRVALLAGKLRAEIARGGRIFVHRKSVHDQSGIAEMFALSAALNARGPNRLLVVTEAGQSVAPPRLIAPGLALGEVDRFAPGDRAGDVSLASWIALCGAVRALFGGGRAGGSAQGGAD